MTHLCLTIRWLDDRYHGLLDRAGPPEWPPSPFRLFQALVAGVARRGELDAASGKALEWLQTLEPPVIIAPRHQNGQAIIRFVPNNDGDKKFDRQDRLTAKPTMPTIMLDPPVIHYLWTVGEDCPEVNAVVQAARCLTCLGWGIDMAFADGQLLGQEQIGKLTGIRWLPKPGAFADEGMLRVPVEGTLADLRDAHQSALNRIEDDKPLKTVNKPRVFDRIFYASSERPLGRPWRIFELRTGTDDTFRYPHAKLIHIAGMVRHVAIKAMLNFPPTGVDADWVNRVVRGKRDPASDEHKQFSYVPLPSIGHEHADAMIRRVMIVAPSDFDEQLQHLASQLDGVTLEPEGTHETCETNCKPSPNYRPILHLIRPDNVAKCYLAAAENWLTVTPVILPGHDEHNPARAEALIRKALLQSGIEQPCTFTWSAIPNFKNCLSAYKYDRNKQRIAYFRPNHLDHFTAKHVRLTFDQPVCGPLAIGAGRHCGLGIFASQ